MKKLWITGVSLSIFLGFQFLQADLPGQDTLVANKGKGTCWTIEKDKNGFEIFKFHATTSRCGWFTAYGIPRDTAGSNKGWPSSLYVKMVNADKPINPNGSENVFYIGGGTFEVNRSLKFGPGSKVACYGCQPKTSGITGNLPVNCAPNDGDPAKRAACWQGYDALDCSKQIDCSKVVDITECYSEGKGVFANEFNDLQLCDERTIGIILGTGKGSAISETEATTQAGQITGAGAAVGNISGVAGITAPAA